MKHNDTTGQAQLFHLSLEVMLDGTLHGAFAYSPVISFPNKGGRLYPDKPLVIMGSLAAVESHDMTFCRIATWK